MVTWVNDDTAPHTVTSGTVDRDTPTPDGRFDSGIMNPGDSFPFVFDSAGEYPYYCSIHPWMAKQGHLRLNESVSLSYSSTD